eukprot:6213476-Pleurochrysis_carterae.AAC.6
MLAPSSQDTQTGVTWPSLRGWATHTIAVGAPPIRGEMQASVAAMQSARTPASPVWACLCVGLFTTGTV